jgi:uncharacterized protein YndB with AHSA1/START domain
MNREIRVERHRVIRAPIHRVWQVLSRLESHPRYANLWLTADLLERSQASAVVEFRGFFGGLPITSVQRLTLRPPNRIEFKQIRGTLRGVWGAYHLIDTDGETDLMAQMAVDAGIVLFSEGAVRQILAAHLDCTLGKIKASVERDLVRPARRRAPPGGASVTTADGAESGSSDEVHAPGGPAIEGAVEVEAVVGHPEESRPSHPASGESRGRRRRRRRRRPRGAESEPASSNG